MLQDFGSALGPDPGPDSNGVIDRDLQGGKRDDSGQIAVAGYSSLGR